MQNFYFTDFHVYPRYILAIKLVIYTVAESVRIDWLYHHLLEDIAQQGYSEYRTHVKYMDDVASHFDFNNGVSQQFAALLKNVLEPNGIISPGKSGIWNSGSVNFWSALAL